MGPEGLSGYNHVCNLDQFIFELRDKPYISESDAQEVIRLFNKLPEGDQQPLRFPMTFDMRKAPSLGHFGQKSMKAARRKKGMKGVETATR